MISQTSALVILSLLALPTSSSDDCPLGGCWEHGGIYNGYSKSRTKNLPRHAKTTITKHHKKKTIVVPYQYRIKEVCKGSSAGRGCLPNFGICIRLADASGPLVDIYRRTVLPDDKHGHWNRIGQTCYATLVPNTKNKPRLTMTMIKHAWAQTPFAKPHITSQPVGHRTLVTLPTYFALNWPHAGYQPDEVRTVTLLDHKVRIKPTFKHNTFSFGDHTTSGDTTSNGGPYPTGDITHAYQRAGTYTTRITTTYGGQFSVDGGTWTTIPGTIDITGPPQTLRVLTATNRLVTH